MQDSNGSTGSTPRSGKSSLIFKGGSVQFADNPLGIFGSPAITATQMASLGDFWISVAIALYLNGSRRNG